MDICPACERRFNKLEDFPIIYVSEFRRLNVPADLVFPNNDWVIYVGPTNRFNLNPKPPKQVLNFFRHNRQATEFRYRSSTWRHQGDWESGGYFHSQDNVRDKIFSCLAPYFNRIEKLVKHEVQTRKVLPDFLERKDFGGYIIPATMYYLYLEEFKESERCKGNGNGESSKNEGDARKIIFSIVHRAINNVGTLEMHTTASVGLMFYEGRVKRV